VVGIWELGRTLATSVIQTIVLTTWRIRPWLQLYGLTLTIFSPFVQHKSRIHAFIHKIFFTLNIEGLK